MQNNGWIKLHRIFSEWEWYQNDNMVRLFIHFLLLANHENGKWQGQNIKEGQFITGRKSLSEQIGLSEQTIRSCINRLKSTSEITTLTTNKYTIITIVKWKEYQGKSTSISTNTLTNNQPTTNQQLTTNKKDKEREECKEGEGIAPIGATPSNKARDFFLLKERQEEVIKLLLDKGYNEIIIRQEMKKFISYWTESNKSGTKQRWEGENYFDINRRLTTWFKNYENFKGQKINKIGIAI